MRTAPLGSTGATRYFAKTKLHSQATPELALSNRVYKAWSALCSVCRKRCSGKDSEKEPEELQPVQSRKESYEKYQIRSPHGNK